MSTNKLLIACKVFYDELQSILPLKPELKIIWIEAALHANLNRLEGGAEKSPIRGRDKRCRSSVILRGRMSPGYGQAGQRIWGSHLSSEKLY